MTNEVVSKIEQLKLSNQAKTSEQLFHIDEPIEHQCPKFDELVKKVKSIHKTSQISRYDSGDIDELLYKLKDIEWDASDLEDEINELREAITSVRQWGEEWKRFAKGLIENNDIDMDKYV